MLAIGRALMSHPKLLILDEPSLGLAPIVVESVFKIIKDISGEGVSILLIEQNLVEALALASRGYVLESGRIALEGNRSCSIMMPFVGPIWAFRTNIRKVVPAVTC